MFGTHYYETMMLNTFRGITATGVSSLFVALFMSNPTNTGAAGVEVSYTGYARQPVTFTPPYEESGGIGIRSTNDILFPAAPSDVGQASHIGIYDSATLGSGNMVLYGELTIPLEIRAGQQPSVYTGEVLYFILGDYGAAFKTSMLNVLRGQNMAGFTPHIALFDGDPEGTGVELAGGAYARPEMVFGAPTVQAGGQVQVQSADPVRFNPPTTVWGMWAWDAIMTDANGAGLAVKMANPNPEVLNKNYVPHFAAGAYRVALN